MQEDAAKKKRPHQLSLDEITHYDEDEDEEEYAGTLTAQLAETAVSVREMSKQLGTSASLRLLPLKAFAYGCASIMTNRTRASSFHHPACPYCHESSR
jgi:hypothetical protein